MKKIILAITLGIITVSAFSQKVQNKHEVSIWAGGGISSLQYDLSNGDHNLGFGGLAGLGYNYFMSYHWSIGIGAEFSLLNSTTKFYGLTDSYYLPQITTESRRFEVITSSNNYKQEETAYLVNVPLTVRYQTDAFGKHKFYADAGLKVGIPIKASYDSWGNLTTSGYEYIRDAQGNYNKLNLDPYTNLPGRFGTYTLSEQNNFDLDLSYMATVEAGLKWGLCDKWALYTGVYFDYGLNDIRKGGLEEQDNRLFAYDASNTIIPYTTNSAIYASYANQSNIQSYANKVNTIGFGLKVRLSLGFKSHDFDPVVIVPEVFVPAPKEPVTVEEMEEIVGRNTQAIINNQNANMEKLTELLKKEPDFSGTLTGFDYDKKEILAGMYYDLDKTINILKRNPEVNLLLEGHTDNAGSEQYNYQLGLDRANAVKDYMVSRGISADRLSVSSKGATQPAYPNTNENSRRLNRRVEYIVR